MGDNSIGGTTIQLVVPASGTVSCEKKGSRHRAIGETVGKLVLFLADGTTMDVPLDKERITIGRRADNDICLPYPRYPASMRRW